MPRHWDNPRPPPEYQTLSSKDWFIEAQDHARKAIALLVNNGLFDVTISLPGGKLVIDR